MSPEFAANAATAFESAIESPHFQTLLQLALTEDIGSGDVTSENFIKSDATAHAFIVARSEGRLAGSEVAAAVFRTVDPSLEVNLMLPSGSHMGAGAHVLEIRGHARSILTAERTALNFAQRLSGVASLTARFVDAIESYPAQILDTRKTTPGFRALEKAAVLAGGALNHRMGLYDRAMVKDNHLFTHSDIEQLQAAINRFKQEKPGVEVELEADTIAQVESFLQLDGVDHILLDNMSNELLTKSVQLRGSSPLPLLEASGGVSMDTVVGIAATGVDYISVGGLTHSAGSLDLGLDFL